MTYELIIKHENTIQYPPIAEDVTVEWEREGQPGKMKFTAVKTDALNFEEGDPVRFSVDGEPFFYGFVFEKKRSGSSDREIKVTAYDQLYYLKNKDDLKYEDKTAAEVIKMLAEDFRLNLGTLTDTEYKIETRTEENKSLFDMIENALDETLKATAKLYVLYDKAGELTLSYIGDMKLDCLISGDTAGDFDYTSTIADETYNRIKLRYEDDDTGAAETYISQDGETMNQWGVLQYFEEIDDNSDAQTMADALLSLYDQKTRSLKVKNTLGDTRVRAGCLVPVILGLGDMNISNYMLCEQVKHTFGENEHTMDVTLRGGTFVA